MKYNIATGLSSHKFEATKKSTATKAMILLLLLIYGDMWNLIQGHSATTAKLSKDPYAKEI